jgi:hypothetical protein
MKEPFRADGTRHFRFPFIPLLSRIGVENQPWNFDRWSLRRFPFSWRYPRVWSRNSLGKRAVAYQNVPVKRLARLFSHRDVWLYESQQLIFQKRSTRQKT